MVQKWTPKYTVRSSADANGYSNLQTAGLCGTMTFDGRTSSGGASRTLSSFWSVAPAEATVLEAFAPFNGSLLAALNVTALDVGTTYFVSLSVENFLGMSDRATSSVLRT